MKRFLKIVMVIALLVPLFSINKSVEANDQFLEGKTVGFSQTDHMSAWRTNETDSIEQAVKNAGGNFVVKDAGGDIATQEADIRDLIGSGVDYLVVAPLEDNGLQGALEEAMANGIPVILVDRKVDGQVGVHYTTAITSDFIWQGEQAANVVAEALPDGGNVVIINGGYDSSTSTDRQEGFTETLDASKFNIVAEQDGSWLMDQAQAVMENIIQAQGVENIDVVYGITDDMIQGVKRAIESNGAVPGEDILTVGIDGTKTAIQDVIDGVQLASITSTPFLGEKVVDSIQKIENGEELEEHIIIEDTVITQENADVEMGY